MSFSLSLNKIYQFLENFSNRIVKLRFWKITYTILVSLFCLITAKPVIKDLNKHHVETISHQIKYPFKPIPEKYIIQNEKEFNGSKSHLDKLGFRFMAPLLGHVLNLDYIELVYLQIFVFSFFFYFLLIFFENNQFENSNLLIAPLILATTFVAKWGFYDAWYFDGFAYLFILISICNYHPLLSLASGLAACFVDERSIFALLINIFYVLRVAKKSPKTKISSQFYSLVFVLLMYMLIRWFLENNFNIKTGTSGIGGQAINFNFQYLPLTLFTTYEFSIVIVLLAFWSLSFTKKTDAFILLCLSGILVLISNLVFDVSRSLAYGFPIILISLILVSKVQKPNSLTKIFITVVFLNLLLPAYSFCANYTLLKPIYFDEINYYLKLFIERIFI